MRQLKKWVSHNVLDMVYKLYVRTHLEYDDVIFHTDDIEKSPPFVFDSRNFLAKKIESIQYEAARILTGAWKGTSIKKLYNNLGWESLNDRRVMRKLCVLHNTLNNRCPRYLFNLVNIRQFSLDSRYCNQFLLKAIPCNKTIYKTSFLPSTIADWNKLDTNIKDTASNQIFKNRLLNKIRPKKSPYFGMSDNDKVKYITMLRMNLSPLRAHKHKYNFADTSDPMCHVCKTRETTEHFLLHCRYFTLSRATMMRKISSIIKRDPSNIPQKCLVSVLLYGIDGIGKNENLLILNEVANFIARTKRLDTY